MIKWSVFRFCHALIFSTCPGPTHGPIMKPEKLACSVESPGEILFEWQSEQVLWQRPRDEEGVRSVSGKARGPRDLSGRGLSLSNVHSLSVRVALPFVWGPRVRARVPAKGAGPSSGRSSASSRASPSLSTPGRPPPPLLTLPLWLSQGPGDLHAVGPVPALLQLPHGRQHEEDHSLAPVRHLPFLWETDCTFGFFGFFGCSRSSLQPGGSLVAAFGI